MLSVAEQRILAVAIDLKTDDCGYAFSFYHNPTKVMFRNWFSEPGIPCYKVPTCVLCNPAGEFHSFGHEAENTYSTLIEDDKHHKWYFFRKFKDMLPEKQVNMGFELTDEKGLKMPAMKVFSMAIRYFKDDLLERSAVYVSKNEIQWVLLLPTTWSVSAKELLIEAATKAGIDGANLTLALEPHAAAVYCQLLPSDAFVCGGRFDDDKYMVIDLGDNTAVFTVHEKQPNGKIKVHSATSGPWCSAKVTEEFTQIIIKIFGERTFKTFCHNSRDDLLNVLRDLEKKKKEIRLDTEKTMSIFLPISLQCIYMEHTGKRVKDALEQSPFKSNITMIADKIKLDAELFRSLFKNCVNSITNHIENICQKPGVKGTSTFLMIGTFSDLPLVQESLIKAFPKGKVVIPKDAGRLAIKGAVVLGHTLGETCDYNVRFQQPTTKDNSSVATTFDLAKQDEDDVSSDSYASGTACSSSAKQGVQKDPVRTLKCQSLHKESEDALSSDFVEMNIQTQNKSNQGLKTQLKNQKTLKADNTRAPSNDELFALSVQLDKLYKEWWLLAKLLGLSDKEIDNIEHSGADTHIVRQYYKMLIAWKDHNAGKEKGSVKYLLKQCDVAGIDRKVTDTVFGN